MIHHGDCLEVMAGMDPESVDAIVTDPPYGLEFMGKEWDRLGAITLTDPSVVGGFQDGNGGNPFSRSRVRYGRDVRSAQAWHQQWAEAAYRVAKPSAYLLAFGGTRTVHRMTVALEDAGWIIRDMLVWGYASGFPKSKASLKPAWEPIVMARKPGPLRMLAIDECRIPLAGEVDYEFMASRMPAWNRKAEWDGPAAINPGPRSEEPPAGRWPANIVLTDPTLGSDYSRFFTIPGGDACDWCGVPIAGASSAPPSEPVGSARSRAVIATVGPTGSTDPRTDSPPTSVIERTSWLDDDGTTPSIPRSRQPGTSPASEPRSSRAKSPDAASPAIAITTTTGVRWMCATCAEATTSATTGPSPDRDYPWALLIPKADRADREPVLGGLPLRKPPGWSSGEQSPGTFQSQPTPPRQNVHPTVKPTDLMRHLVRLVTPTGGIVLDPFLGSGTTGLAAEMEGFAWIGIEREAEYVAIAEARLNGTQRGLGLETA